MIQSRFVIFAAVALAFLLPGERSAALSHEGVSLSVVNQAITVAWDANPDTVDGYKVHYGTSPKVYTSHIDVGKVTTWGTTLAPGTYYFVVTAYNGSGESGPSAEVVTTVAPVQTDDCAPPLGTKAVSIFITKLETTTGSVGSQARLNFQLGSSQPISQLTVKLNDTAVDQPVGAIDASLNKVGGIWFTTPLQPGTYAVSLTAANAAGCSTTATKDAGGKPLTVTVK